ncbi:nuclear transport factor 2 family protein [Algoriphagus sediminis]|uniref:Nuclear transport factor 2 family protein n=1 Tax=Algoriphagus sediminis TaxID=3057113 RepID=A0ABT7YE15_9BACT|nr:nuclear transport factor 2 family protein [Algoriphagus sediminis]MDN3204772.1 nuclear transport factor 2 family protein [Algoriphagus sediminis]
MLNLQREKLIDGYISAYNQKDLKGMLKPLHEDVVFENYSKGELTHSTQGIHEFEKQARKALDMFETREQSPEKYIHQTHHTDLHLKYRAILGKDFPDGNLKKGDEISLKGRSVFTFKDGLISKIQDYS